MTEIVSAGGEVVPLRGDQPLEAIEVDAAEVDAVAAETAAPKPAAPVYADVTVTPERRPVIPVRLQRENLRYTLENAAEKQWYRFRYYVIVPRFLLYLAVVVWAVVGLVRLFGVQLHWFWLLEQHDLRADAVIAGDSREWRALHREAKETRKNRGRVLLAELAAVTAAAVALAHFSRWWLWAAVGCVTVPLLAWYGRPPGQRIVAPAIIPPQYTEPTHENITEALGSLGITNINAAIKAGRGITFVSPVYRDGPGWGVQLDLPQGVTAENIIARRPEFASALRRPLSATWPEGVPAEHPGRLALWVGFHDISKQKPPKYPLLKSGGTDIFTTIPFGTDPRLRPRNLPLFEVNYLIGASPGQGKTAAVRAIACGASLDPVADVWIHEQAGKGDLEPLAQVCHRYCSGLDDEAVAYSADSARMLRAELERRSLRFKKLPKEAKPEGKLTRELAVRYRDLRPIVAIFDEAQVCFLHPRFGAQMAEDLSHVMRLGRAYGIIIVISTQRPDKDSVPTAITGVVTGRFCLKVPDHVSNDLVLGTGSYKAGYSSVIFRAKTDAGLGWLKADAEPQIVRTYYLDLIATAKTAARARVMREHAGVLSGYALGLDDETGPVVDVLADLLTIFNGDAGMHWGVAADRLAERYPDRWADATAEALSAQCRSLGVKSVDVRMDGTVLKGCRRVAVEAAGR